MTLRSKDIGQKLQVQYDKALEVSRGIYLISQDKAKVHKDYQYVEVEHIFAVSCTKAVHLTNMVFDG